MSWYTKITPLPATIFGIFHLFAHKWELVGGYGPHAFVTFFFAVYFGAGFLSLAFMAFTGKMINGKWFLLLVIISGAGLVFCEPVVRF